MLNKKKIGGLWNIPFSEACGMSVSVSSFWLHVNHVSKNNNLLVKIHLGKS